MQFLVSKMKWVMLVSGLLTLTMLQATFAPEAAVRGNFGTVLDGPAAAIIVRNWGALIGLMGAMLVYGAFNPASRPLVLVVAGTSKLVFIGLVLAYGAQLPGHSLGIAVAVDSVMIALFAAYLVATRAQAPAQGLTPT